MTHSGEKPGPISKRQHMYVTSECDITLYGGAAGSGKSEIGVIDFLQYTDIPNFIGVITRRFTTQMKGPGGILTKCKRIFSKVYEPHEYTWKDKEGKFVFHNSGAEIYLKHYENENAFESWQGIEANLFMVDEGTQFSQDMIQYIMSRMRNPSCPEVEPRLKITCNPDADHFLKKFVEPYLQEDGTPDRSKDGLIRYFLFENGDFVFGNTREELVSQYQVSPEDVLSFKFIGATVDDNPILKKVNPKYVSWLKGLKGVERERLLKGNWTIRQEGSGFYKREWLEEVIAEPPDEDFDLIVRAYDFAGSLPTDSYPNPDYTASVKMGRRRADKKYVILDANMDRIRSGDWVRFVLENAERDGKHVHISLPIDPNPAAKSMVYMMMADITAHGYSVSMQKASGKKVDRFRPFASACQNELVSIVKNCMTDLWNKIYHDNNVFHTQLERFDGSRGIKDD